MLSNEVVERLDELLAKATPGPWRVDHCYGGDVRADSGDVFVAVYRGMKLIEVTGHEKTIGPESRSEAETNGAMIAAAVNALPELLRVYRLWLDAPVAWQNPLGGVLTNDAVRLDGTDTTGWKRVRLVRDGDSGEGES